MESFKVGQRVKVQTKNAIASVAFIGETYFSDGVWIGVIFDDPIGNHDGAVDGNRYFNCPDRHGLFIKPSLIQCIDENDRTDIEQLPHNSQPKTSSKQKNVSQTDNCKNGLLLNSTEQQPTSKKFLTRNLSLTERNLTKQNKELLLKLRKMEESLKKVQHKHMKDVSELKDKLKSTEELSRNFRQQKITISKENKDLKERIKWQEDVLKNVEEKRVKLLEVTQNLRMELDNRKKQVKIQKCHIKLLKMRQNNHSCKTHLSDKNDLNQVTCKKRSSLDDFLTEKIESNLKTLDDEIDLENAKVLSKIEKVVELEEQNKMMIEGLVELRDFLKDQTKTSSSQEEQDKRGEMPIPGRKSIAFFVPVDAELKAKEEQYNHETLGVETFEEQLEKYRNVLKELTMYTKLLTTSRKSDETKPNKCFQKNFSAPLQFSENTIPYHSKGIFSSSTAGLQHCVGDSGSRSGNSQDFIPIQNDNTLKTNRMQNCLPNSNYNSLQTGECQGSWPMQHFTVFNDNRMQDRLKVSNHNNFTPGKTSDIESIPNANNSNGIKMQNCLQASCHTGSSWDPSKTQNQLRRQHQMMTSKTDKIEVMDPLEELEQLMNVVPPKLDDKIRWNTNLSPRKHGRLVNEIPSANFVSGSQTNTKSGSNTKFSFSLTPQQIKAAIKSIGNNAVASKKKDKSQQQVPFTFQRPRTQNK